MRTRRSQSSSDSVSSPLDKARGKQGHQAVLLHEAVEALSLSPEDVVVDATLGGAGHARHLAERLGEEGTLIGFDLDSDAIARAGEALSGARPKVHLIQADFRNITEELAKIGKEQVTKALFDLGWSSYQLDSGRGFSFLRDEPLQMTYASKPGPNALTAEIIVNTWEEGNIADVIWGWGGERYSRRIAHAIVEARTRAPIKTASRLAEIITSATPAIYRRGRIHPATRTFQALRIAVNDELGALTEGLKETWKILASGGRIAVIAFHSAEDRIVKQMFVEWEKSDEGKRITKKPIRPTAEEIQLNPRARSAKLRVIQKL